MATVHVLQFRRAETCHQRWVFHVTMSGIETPAQRSSHCSEAQPDTKRQRIDQPNSAPVLTKRSILRQSAAAATAHGCAACRAQTAPEQQDEGCTTSRAVIPASEAQHAACQTGDSACQSPAPAQHDAGNSPEAAQPQQAQHSGSTAARADSQAPVPELPAHEGGIGELAADDSLAQRQADGGGPAAAQQARRRLRSFYGSPGQTAVELRIQRFLQVTLGFLLQSPAEITSAGRRTYTQYGVAFARAGSEAAPAASRALQGVPPAGGSFRVCGRELRRARPQVPTVTRLCT